MIASAGPEGDAPSGINTPALVVRARQARGRRRAGRAFAVEPTSIPLSDLSPADRAAIEGDPELIVDLAEID